MIFMSLMLLTMFQKDSHTSLETLPNYIIEHVRFLMTMMI